MAKRIGQIPSFERRGFWVVVFLLCAIALVVSIRRLVSLAGPLPVGHSNFDVLNAVFAAKPGLTRSHVVAGLVLALAIPLQLSTRVRLRYPGFHRWFGRFLMAVGLSVGVTGYPMLAPPPARPPENSSLTLFLSPFFCP